MGEDLRAIERRLATASTFARRATELFFRRIEVDGASRVPADGPLLIVGNHGSGLIDPALFLAFLPRRPRFLALSTLWDMLPLRPLLSLGAAIPIYQRRHIETAGEKNLAVFEKCYEALAAGGVIGLFPEGRSHDEPALAEIKTGAARIALETLARHPDLTIRIVPVGLTFEEKTRFRSRVLITVGKPFEPLDALARRGFEGYDPVASGAEPGAVRALTDALREALIEVTLNYPSWEEARLIERAVAIYERPTPQPPTEPTLGPSFKVRQLFIDGYAELKQREPELVERVRREVAEYDAELELYRLHDRHVIADYPPPVVFRFTIETLNELLARLPLGVIGTVLNFVPFWACDLASRRAPKPDEISTYKIVAALFFYPLTWLLEGVLVGWLLSPAWGVAAALLGPLSGYFAIRLQQHMGSFIRHARAFLFFRAPSARMASLRERRSALLEDMRRLADKLAPTGP